MVASYRGAVMEPCDVLIVGAGPVGLLLGCLLAQRSVAVRVLESREAPTTHSRAIGIHPTGLRCLEAAGLAPALLRHGVQVRRGRVFAPGRAYLGSVDFSHLVGAYPYVLTLPQAQCERLLEQRLHEIAPDSLLRGVRVTQFSQAAGHCQVMGESGARAGLTFRARYVIACDGRNSMLRELAGLPYPGACSRQPFIMGDCRDDTDFGSDAAIFLGGAGLVESFPLPGAMRRWVMSVREAEASLAQFATTILRRTGLSIDVSTVTMLSSFHPEYHLAADFVRGRLLLAGDAAHVLSPIGGQGMNLGFEDALALSTLLAAAREQGWTPPDTSVRRHVRTRRRAARRAMWRARMFTALGTSGAAAWSRALVQLALTPRLHDLSARMFTMGG
jgi:2-polyprenyl-6-methoxyphenol hydroxylase-like FAD-dependent oxidoreductase